MQSNLAYDDTSNDFGDGDGFEPAFINLTLTEEEAAYLYGVMEGAALDDEEAHSIRSRVRAGLGLSPCTLVVSNS